MAEKETPKETQSEAKNADNKDAGANVPAKSGAKQWILAILLLAGLVIGSASAAVVVASILIRPSGPQAEKKAAEAKADEEKKAGEKKPCEFALENALIVNVYQTQQRRYLSVKPVFVLDSEDTQKKLKDKQVELQHLMISVLKKKTLDQLDDPDSANVIGREIQEMVNLKFSLNNAVTSVYFTQFVVQ